MKKVLFLLNIIYFCNVHAVKQVNSKGKILCTSVTNQIEEHLTEYVTLKNNILQKKQELSFIEDGSKRSFSEILLKSKETQIDDYLEEIKKIDPQQFKLFAIKLDPNSNKYILYRAYFPGDLMKK